VLDGFFVAHVPRNLGHVYAKHFGNGRGPASAADDCKFWMFFHVLVFGLAFLQKKINAKAGKCS
jgi:hypothetical protein